MKETTKTEQKHTQINNRKWSDGNKNEQKKERTFYLRTLFSCLVEEKNQLRRGDHDQFQNNQQPKN